MVSSNRFNDSSSSSRSSMILLVLLVEAQKTRVEIDAGVTVVR